MLKGSAPVGKPTNTWQDTRFPDMLLLAVDHLLTSDDDDDDDGDDHHHHPPD